MKKSSNFALPIFEEYEKNISAITPQKKKQTRIPQKNVICQWP
jgi:hypothetical protein